MNKNKIDAVALNQFRLALCVLEINLSETPRSFPIQEKIRKLIYNTLASHHNLQEYVDGWDAILEGLESHVIVDYSKLSVSMHCVFEALQVLIQPMLTDGWAGEEKR